MISVVIPARNCERTISAAVRSTLAFLPPRAEVLVHDDGSTDSTARILRSIRDPRLSVTSLDGQQGVARSLNALVERAQHDWIARMDADDITLPGRFPAQLQAGREGYDLVFAHRVNFGTRPGAFRQARGVRIEPDTLGLLMLFENPLTHPTLLARRSALLLDGGYRDGPAEDYDLWLRLQRRFTPIVSISRPVIAYRKHRKQVTQSAHYSARFKEDEQLASNYRAVAAMLGAPPFLAEASSVPAVAHLSAGHLSEFRSFLRSRASHLAPAQQRIVARRLSDAIARPHHSRLSQSS